MDWLKQNPFQGALALAAALVLLVGGYLVFSEAARHTTERENFDASKASLEALLQTKPFPSEANVKAADDELAETVKLLDDLAKQFDPGDTDLTPQAFQDELSQAVQEITGLAAQKGATLPEGFYLGFESYEAQPPAPEAAPALGGQLRAILAVVRSLLEARVQSIVSVSRPALPQESAEEAKDAEAKQEAAAESAPRADFDLAPFDISFVADQASFRTAFNRLPELKPQVLVRLVSLANSAPVPPSKSGGEADPVAANPAGQEQAASTVRAVVGRETVRVDLRLASAIKTNQAP